MKLAGGIARLILPSLLLLGCTQAPTLTTSSPEALRLYTEGVSQWEKVYYREAITSFTDALAKDSTFAMAWARLAAVNASSKNQPEALKDIANAVQYSSRATQREQLIIRMWYHRFHYAFNEAAAVADSLIRLYPKEKEGYLVRGNLYETSKSYDAAIRSYQKAIEADTSYALAVMSLGYAYSNIGEQEKALVQMQHYIQMAPLAADPRASYADLLLRVGRYDEALDQYRKSLELKPDYWYAVNEIGVVYAVLGRLREAEEQFHASLALLPPSTKLEASHLVADASLNLQRGKEEEAERQCRDALTQDSSNAGAAISLVDALARLKRFSQAEDVTERIRQEIERRNLTESPAMLEFHLMKARLLRDQGEYEEALGQCKSALEFSSPLTRGLVYTQISEIRRREKSYESALDAAEEALQVNPNYPEALLTLLRIYKEKGDDRMTREIGGRLLDLWKTADPDFQHAIEVRKLLGLRGPA